MLGRATFLGVLAAIAAMVTSPSSANAVATAAASAADTNRTPVAQGSSHVQYSIRSGQTKVRGVNLGSWLVAEH
ncbi:hypothetical protein Gpo141_00006424, partial [Globisporangium polare]